MESKDYVVNRDDIYVGDVCGINPEKIVIYPDGIFDYSLLDFGFTTEEKLKKDLEGRLYLFKRDNEQLDYGWGGNQPSTSFTRTMLFVLDENNRANDLLYNSPHYPIFNISPNIDCLNSPICILHNTYQLASVLRYFGYRDKLTYDDIIQIRKELFSCDFVLNNCELFGRYETDPHESSYEVHDSKGNHRTFNLIKDDSILSSRYFDCFICNKDQFIIEGIRYSGQSKEYIGVVKDMFLPDKNEEKIKSLHK